MPKDVESGQVAWFEEAAGSLIGRAEVANIEDRIASSFSCGECGPCTGLVYNSCAMTPPSGSALPGVTGYMFAPRLMKRDCHYVLYGPYSPLSTINWFSDNTSAVTVDSAGNETTVFPGSANIVAQWQDVVGYNYSCAQIYANVATSARCDVIPLASIDFTGSGIPLANGTPPPLTWPSYINSVTMRATGAPEGGTYHWVIGDPTTNRVTLSNVDSQTVTVTSKAASLSYADVLIEVDYTVNRQTGTGFILTQVQQPTSLRFVSGTNSTANDCSSYPGTTGLQKDISWQLMDQLLPSPILFQIPGTDSLAANSGQNGCAIDPFRGTPATLMQYTDPNGIWPHHYDFCTGRCACQTNGVQKYFFNGFEIDQSFTFSCSGITVAGH